MQENQFTLTNEDGVETACELLFTYQVKDTGKHYMVYTDHTPDESGFEKVFASIYHPHEKDAPIEGIETDEEWDMVDMMLEAIQDTAEGEEPKLDDNIVLTACYI